MPRSELRTGDHVSFNIGPTRVHARVIEDRGHLGKGGRQIVRLEVTQDFEPGEPQRFEMPAEELTRERSAA